MKIPKVKHSENNNSAIDKSMPSQSGANPSNGEGASDTGFNKNLTNVKKYGGKPPSDESIANRGAPKANANKDKAV